MKKRILFFLTSISILLFLFSCNQNMQKTRSFMLKMPVAAAGAKKVGNQACADCHEELVNNFKANVHGRIIPGETPIGEVGCETCHGPGSVHIDEEEPSKIINPKKIDAVAASSICLRCHTGDEHQDWNGSEHALNDISCVKCHKVHNNHNKALLTKKEPYLCYSCHQNIKAKSYYPTHHPVKEGKMVCSDCHANHGSVMNNLKTDERLNDLCLNCHTRYQGPFTFEHSPVVEDCTICHEPHGTVANNLLKQNEPFLCLQCHDLHFHTAIQSPNTAGMPYLNPNTDASKTNQILEKQQNMRTTQMFMGTKCTTCHPSVHGSELPSLSVPSHGRGLTR
jgi:DmsE family decaheme c-type cytochrome